MSEAKNIYEKLAAIQARVGDIPKEGWNSFSKYKYVTKDTLYDYFRRYFADERLFVFASTVSVERGQRQGKNGETMNMSTVTKQLTIVNLDNPQETFTVNSTGVGEDKTDKDIYQGDTGAMKYFLIDNFLVSGGDSFPGDVEHDSNEQKKQPEPKKEIPSNAKKLANKVGENQDKLPERFKEDCRIKILECKESGKDLTDNELQTFEAAIVEHVENFDNGVQ